MQIEISRGIVLETGNHYIRVDFYKSEDAYMFPDEHPDEIWNCCCTFDVNDPTKPNDLNIIDRLLSIIETSVNGCLKEAEKI